ncbi:MAG: hypothetical protein IM638_18195 [Bacteroidetes bacterium]|nr:hypothetical protein [Bacteroidota bacterium]
MHYHEDEVLSLRMRKQIAQAELLFYRHFHKESAKLLFKTIDLCNQAGLHEIELDAVNLLMRIYVQESADRFADLNSKKRELLAVLDEIQQYSELLAHVIEITNGFTGTTHAGSERAVWLLEHELMQQTHKPRSIRAEILRHSIYVQYYYASRINTPQLIVHSEQMLELFTANKWIAAAHLPELTAVLMNNLSNYYVQRDTVKLTALLKHAEGILNKGISRSGYLPLLIDSMFILGKLYLCNLEGNFEKALKLEKQVLHFSNELLKIGHPRSYMLIYNFVIACLLAGNYRKPIRVLAMADALREQYYGDVRFRQLNYLLMFCYLKTGGYELLRSVLTAINEQQGKRTISEAERYLQVFYQQVAKGVQVKIRQLIKALENKWESLKTEEDVLFFQHNQSLRVLLRAQLKGTDFASEWNR